MNRHLQRFVSVCFLFAAIVSLSAVVGSQAEAAGDTTPVRPSLVQGSQQLLVVTSANKKATRGVAVGYDVVVREGKTTWLKTLGPFAVRLGRNGVSSRHREGDGTTPQGSWGIVSLFGLAANVNSAMPYRQVKKGDCWVSQVQSPRYNMYSRGKWCVGNVENLWSIAKSGPYSLAVVTDYNMNPVVKNIGSAIFIHGHSYASFGGTQATSGCISTEKETMRKLSTWLDPLRSPRVVVGTTDWLQK